MTMQFQLGIESNIAEAIRLYHTFDTIKLMAKPIRYEIDGAFVAFLPKHEFHEQ